MTADPIEACLLAYAAADPVARQDSRARWVMNRAWYDRLRAAACSPVQERARADAHTHSWIMTTITPPVTCVVCGGRPFDTVDALMEHMRNMADPEYREPDDEDQFVGFRIEVRDDGGEPHLEAPRDDSAWIPLDPDGLPPRSYPHWRRQQEEQAERRPS